MRPFVIPVRRCRASKGAFRLPDRPVLRSARDADALPVEQLAEHLKRRLGLRARVAWGAAGPADVRFARTSAVKDPEGYRLTVGADGAAIEAATDAGAYYGAQTLIDLLTAHGRSLPRCRIDDRPDFARRGVYVDVARGKVPTVETLKALVERLAHWKINELQLYVKNTFTWQAHPAIGRGFSPYRPADLLAVQAHCRLHHVRFVPSLATLSHNELILQLPAYRHLAELAGYRGWEGGTMLCPTDPRSFRLVRDLYAEFVPLFEAADMNVCCDEPWELGRGRSRRKAAQVGAGRVYLDFLLKVRDLCAQHGKRMNAWGDIVLQRAELIPELPRDVVMLNWDYAAEGGRIRRTREFTDRDIPTMVCPGTSAWQRHGTDLPNAVANVANFARVGRKLGVEGLLNTDWGDFGHRNPLGVSLHGYAHGAAHAWHGTGVDEATFTETFARHVFGDTKRMPNAIRTLGAVAARAGRDSNVLYHALVEPLRPPADRFVRRFRKTPVVAHYPDGFPSMIDRADPEGLRESIERLQSPSLWPEPADGLPEFETLALADYRLAAAMDVLAAQRALLGGALRAGEPVEPEALRGWADGMAALREAFETLWRSRFRPSRLAENLKLMQLAEQDALATAKAFSVR
jgi:hypothetical protein